jgi:hypothetical protein
MVWTAEQGGGGEGVIFYCRGSKELKDFFCIILYVLYDLC